MTLERRDQYSDDKYIKELGIWVKFKPGASLRVNKVRLDAGGYERGTGRYYGIGPPLFRIEGPMEKFQWVWDRDEQGAVRLPRERVPESIGEVDDVVEVRAPDRRTVAEALVKAGFRLRVW